MILFGKAGTAVGGFNGAASARSRKSEGYDRLRGRNVASMGPRARARGNGTRRRCRNSQKFSFNGAASARSRKCPRLPSQPAYHRLQWGRERALAEMVRDEERRLKGKELQWGRERALAEIEQLSDIRARLRGASMGPRARARGNPWTVGTGLGTVLLQWGRERALAEIPPATSPPPPDEGFNGAASARSRKLPRAHQPRQVRHGFNGAASARSRKCGVYLGVGCHG